jgi:hypothetical protein
MSETNSSSFISTQNNSGMLKQILLADDIQPGSSPSYELCKLIYLYHPLGAKLVESPIKIAQSLPREISIQNAPEEVVKAFNDEWLAMMCNNHILMTKSLSRIYGISAIALGIVGKDTTVPAKMTELYQENIYFSVFDPLNTAGSLMTSQDPRDPMFNKVAEITVAGETFHKSRCVVVMNENPIYLAYTGSAFGYTGRSVYQRPLYPLKSFIRTMKSDEMIARKLGLLIAMMKPVGSVIEQAMQMVMGLKRALLKEAETDDVLSIDESEKIETLNMMNVDGAGTFARNNIINNIATAADMPGVILRNESYVSGFAEGAEDAKQVAQYIDNFRAEMAPLYKWFDTIVQYRAWNPVFYKEVIQNKYPDKYGDVSYDEFFEDCRREFVASWPSLLIEPESEDVKVEETKLKGITDVINAMAPLMDPKNKAVLLQWAADNISENKIMFPHELVLDMDELAAFHEEQGELGKEQNQMALESGMGDGEGETANQQNGKSAKPPGSSGPGGNAGKSNVLKLPAPSKNAKD